MTPGRLASAAFALALGVSAGLLRPAPAAADAFAIGPPDAGWKGDSVIHTFCWGAGFDVALQDNANWAMGTSLNRDTDIIDSFEACNQAQTDVEWLDANLPVGVRGQYSCQIKLNADTCNHAHVTLDPAEINIGPLDEEDTSK